MAFSLEFYDKHHKSDFQNKNRDYFSRVLEIGESLTKQYWQKISSNFIELGKHTEKLTLVFRKGFESFYGWSEILKFVDDKNNQLVLRVKF